MSLLAHNLSFTKGLDPKVQTFYEEFCRYCFDKNLLFKVLEGRRSYERQILLWTQGRTKNDLMRAGFSQKVTRDIMALFDSGKNLQGSRVTWTIDSDHIKGLAIDIQPINCSHSDISVAAIRWNILHPYMYDPPHYSLEKARAAEPLFQVSPEAKKKALERRIAKENEPEVKESLVRQLLRLTKRLVV